VILQTGPVRLFTPYKRRKRKDTSDGEGGVPRKLKRAVSKDGSNGEDSDAGNYIIYPLHVLYCVSFKLFIFCGGQSGTVAGFLRVLRFPLPIFIPPISPPSPIIWGWYNRAVSGHSTQSPNAQIKKKVFILQ
jgi:hypothetical protein